MSQTLAVKLPDPIPAEIILERANEEWAHDHTHLQELCLKAGYTEKEVYGDRYYVPSIICLADMLFNKIPKQ